MYNILDIGKPVEIKKGRKIPLSCLSSIIIVDDQRTDYAGDPAAYRQQGNKQNGTAAFVQHRKRGKNNAKNRP